MSWTDFPQPFIEKNWGFFADILANNQHGECSEVNLYGNYACQVLVEASHMLVVNKKLVTPDMTKSTREVKLWSLDRRMGKIHAISFAEPDMVFTYLASPDHKSWLVSGVVKTRFLNSRPAQTLKKHFLAAKVADI
jgi:hypothetical protein